MKQQLYQKVEKASKLVLKIGRESWIKAIRESGEEQWSFRRFSHNKPLRRKEIR